MPVIKIMFDRSMNAQLQDVAEDLMVSINQILVDGLASKVASPQVILQPNCYHNGCYKIYVDLQFRASPERSKERVKQVFAELGQLLSAHFSGPIRMRGFAVDQATLTAMDVD